jgi:hypothetical protein
MTSRKGAALDPRSPEYQWVARVIRSVERRTGAPTRWNGTVYEEENQHFLGAAHPDGSMTLNLAKVLDPVRIAYTAGRPLSPDEEFRARDAVVTVVHEAAHLCSRPGDEAVRGSHPAHDAAGRTLEEGLIENWAHENVDSVIYDVGLDRTAPGVLNHRGTDAYPGYSGAARELVDGLARRSGQLSSDQVARQLVRTDRSQRWNAAADLVIDNRLAGLMPEEHRQTVRHQLVAPMRMAFAAAQAMQQDRSLVGAVKRVRSRRATTSALGALDAAVARIEQHYRDWHWQQAQQPRQDVEQQTRREQERGEFQPAPYREGRKRKRRWILPQGGRQPAGQPQRVPPQGEQQTRWRRRRG